VTTYPGLLVRNATQPILPANGEYLGLANTYNAYGKVGPTAIVKDGTTYRAWAEMVAAAVSQGGTQTYGQTGAFDADTSTGYLTSTDGATWTWYDSNADGNPDRVLEPTSSSWMNGEAVPGTVFWDGFAGLWRLWGHGGNNTGPRGIYYATASNPQGPWTIGNSGTQVLQGSGVAGRFDESWVSDPRVLKKADGTYLMLYRGQPASGGPQIGAATSPDGITWTRVGTTPVVAYGSGWDNVAIYPGGLWYDGSTYHLWFGGGTVDDGGDGLGYASSSDGTTWTKAANNPVIVDAPGGSTSQLDTDSVGDTIWAYQDGSLIRVQYGSEKFTPNGGSGTFRSRIEAQLNIRAPLWIGAGTAQFTATNAANIASMSPPNGAIGDLLYLFLARNDNTAAPAAPTGWTADSNLTGVNGTAQSVAAYYKYATSATGTTDATGAVTFGSSTIARGGVVLRFAQPFGAGLPTDVSSRNAVASTATTVTATNVTSTQPYTLGVFVALAVGLRVAGNAMTNWGGTYLTLQTTTLGTDITLAYGIKPFDAAGSYGTPGITWSANTTTGAATALLFGLLPANQTVPPLTAPRPRAYLRF
jgi:hypothetical protein